jgi:L-alanine-DL-glutamate epimerase-like enolase superfamily enzyme
VKLRRAQVILLALPFRMPVSHATHNRTACDSVLVRVEASDGTVGWGEGVPRPYVGGEDASSVWTEITQVLWPALVAAEVPDYEGDLRAFLLDVDSILPDSPPLGHLVAHHAARCAVELAVLDCALRRAGVGLLEALGARRSQVRYNGMLPTGDAKLGRMILNLMQDLALPAVKVKLGDGDDTGRLKMLKEVLGDDVQILADVNGVWSIDEARSADPMLVAAGLTLLEQPLPRGPAAELAELRASIQTPIMVDESLVTLADARNLIDAGACDVFNVRLSKCGGLGRSLSFIELARAAGLRWQLGAHVGETAILSAVGRALALSVDDAMYVEGSIGEWLLEEDLTSPAVQFGHGGYAGPLEGPGFGIEVREERVARHTIQWVELGVDA